MKLPARRHTLFEQINGLCRPLIWWHRRQGRAVSIINFSLRLKARPWLRRLINTGAVESVYVYPKSEADHLAIEATEWLYPQLAPHPLIRRLAAVVGEDELAPALKSALCQELFRYCFLRVHAARQLAADPAQAPIIVVSPSWGRWHARLDAWPGRPADAVDRAPHSVRLHPWSAWLGRWERCIETVRLLVPTLAGLVWISAAGQWRRGYAASPEELPYLYAIDQPFQVKFWGARRFDFLIDEDVIHREELGFLVHPSAEGAWIARAEQAGCRMFRRRALLHPRRVWQSPPDAAMRRRLWRMLQPTLAHLAGPVWLIRAALTGTATALRESALCAQVRSRQYIYTNRDDLIQRWHNVTLRWHGTMTWYFAHSIGGGHPYGVGHEYGGRHRFWAYQSPDHFVVPSRPMLAYHQSHPQAIRHYHDLGNIWSEAIAQTARTERPSQLRAQWCGPDGRDLKVMAWFDTTFIGAHRSPSTYREAAAWYRDLLRLLQDDERLLAVIKPSKDFSHAEDPSREWSHTEGEGLADTWREVARHPRVVLAGHDADPADVIAAADLTVTYTYSSPTAEALGARRRAIWYEPGSRWRGTTYARVPGVVAHGYNELRRVVQQLLFEQDEDAYQRRLTEHAQGVIESYLDGGALTRFRRLLAGDRAARGEGGSAPAGEPTVRVPLFVEERTG